MTIRHRINKKDFVFKIGMTIYRNLNKKNLDASIEMIQKGIGMIGEFGRAFDNPKHSKKSSNQKDVRSAFWGESKKKETRKDTMNFYGKKIPFSRNQKMDFW